MISKDCFTTKWIYEVSEKLNYKDKNLIEKVIRALSLLEMLVESGCPLIFKGGTALMLILTDSLHRLSIDIDIICPPNTDIEEYLKEYKKYGFVKVKQVGKEYLKNNLPLEHAKVYYEVTYTDKTNINEYIRLDILYENNPYQNLIQIPIDNHFIKLEGTPVFVTVPSKEDMLGDKMTTFAPNTIGIPYFKGNRNCNMEIIKQLYDIHRLFDNVNNFTLVYEAFKNVAEVQLKYRGIEGQINKYYSDVRNIALCISTRGKAGQGDIDYFVDGIKRVRSFIFQENYYIDNAIIGASIIAYLATCFEKEIFDIEKYSGNPKDIVYLDISNHLSSKLRKLKTSNPEAFFYWAKTDLLLTR